MRYGNLPEDLGLIDISPVEMLFHMYMPISLPGDDRMYLPEHLKIFCPLIMAARSDCPDRFRDEYVYLTAKTLWVSGDYIGNRPGWHSDGFGTDDLNYIWSDRAPTDFLHSDEGFEFDGFNCDHFYTMCGIMEEDTWRRDFGRSWSIKQYPDKHLLKLDPSMIHRSPVDFAEGMRSFAKVSISKDIYNLEGNASNYLLDTNWKMKPRAIERNHPSKRD
jgi:hypothetical protein